MKKSLFLLVAFAAFACSKSGPMTEVVWRMKQLKVPLSSQSECGIYLPDTTWTTIITHVLSKKDSIWITSLKGSIEIMRKDASYRYDGMYDSILVNRVIN